MDSEKMKIFGFGVLFGVIIVIVLYFLFSYLNISGITNLPFLPTGEKTQVLIIGAPSLGEQVVLDNLSYDFDYHIRDASSFESISVEELKQFNIIVLDESSINDKSVSFQLANSIQGFVSAGGKLIIVLNSGIYQGIGFGVKDYTSADVVGWEATFGSIVPANCVPLTDGSPSCAKGKEEEVVGRIIAKDVAHSIMSGVSTAPPVGEPPFNLSTLNVSESAGALTIAYIKSENTPKTYPAILEKSKLGGGKVIYFNYDPGMTPGILKNTLYYLK